MGELPSQTEILAAIEASGYLFEQEMASVPTTTR
jgi:hypothetical protein